MQWISSITEQRGAREGLLLLGAAAVLIGIGLTVAPEASAVASAALLAHMVAGVFLLVAAVLLYLDWRVHESRAQAWLVAAVVLLSCQLLGSAALALSPQEQLHRQLGWPLVVDLALTGVVVVLAARALEERPPELPDPLVTGFVLGAAGTAARPLFYRIDTELPVAPDALVEAVVICYVALAVFVMWRHSLPGWLAWRLAVTLLLVSGGHAAASPGFPSPLLDVAAGTLLVLAGALWASTSYVLLRASLDMEHRRSAHLETSLLEVEGHERGTREALHELKSTIAGLARASELLGEESLSPERRQRLQQSLIRELARLERRLWHSQAGDSGVVDLDLTLDTVLDLHRARGRVFTWAPTGTRVVGRQDAIAEAVNILLDNAATHGDSTSGRVDVARDEINGDMVRIAVSDDGPGVPREMRQHIFEWGARGPTSGGQGIGLHLARRLVTEQGGSLTLAEAESGSAFVIRLPAARCPEETYGVRAEQPAV